MKNPLGAGRRQRPPTELHAYPADPDFASANEQLRAMAKSARSSGVARAAAAPTS